MREERILHVLGQVDDRYVMEADPMNEKMSGQIVPYRHRLSHKTLIAVAVVTTLLVSSFTAAMAASKEFRNAVFRFFKIDTPEIVLPMEEEPIQSGNIESIGASSIDDIVNIEYIRIDGNFDYSNGIVYLYDDEKAATAYIAENGKLSPLEPHKESLAYVWNGETYSIGFDWYERDGVVYASARNFDIETQTAWDATAIEGNSDFVALTLSYGRQIEYAQYPLLYDLKAKKAIAVLDNCEELKSRQITQTEFAPDLSGIIISCDFETDVYYYNIKNQTLSSLSDLCGMNKIDAWFIDPDTVCCVSMDENKAFTGRTVTLSTGDCKKIFSAMPKLDDSPDGGIVLTGGRYGLFVDEARNTFVYDFKTGESAVVDGFQYPADATFASLNSTEDKILFAKNEDDADGLGVSEIGVLDLRKQSFILFDRKDYEIRREGSIGWFDCDTVAIRASTEEFGYLYLFTIDHSVAAADTE